MKLRAIKSTLPYAVSSVTHVALVAALAYTGHSLSEWFIRVDSGKAAPPVMVIAVAAPPAESVEMLEAEIIAAPPESTEALEPKHVASEPQVVEVAEIQAAKRPLPKPKQQEVAAAPKAPPPPRPAPDLASLPPKPKAKPQPVEPRAAEPAPPLPKAETTLASAPVQPGANVDTLPEKLPNNPSPAYPRDALRAGAQGRVEMRVWVKVDGTVQFAQLENSSGHHSLDLAALATVRRWQFSPGTRAGVPVVSDVLVGMRFVIRGS